MHRSKFSGYSRGTDGCIVTFRMPDDSIEVRHFSSIHRTKNRSGKRGLRTLIRDTGYAQQAIAWADEHEAKVICISTPETILRDLQGTRVMLERKPTGHDGLYGRMQQHPSDVVHYPERAMLKTRLDLFETPGRNR
jgi:hypothetical protein